MNNSLGALLLAGVLVGLPVASTAQAKKARTPQKKERIRRAPRASKPHANKSI